MNHAIPYPHLHSGKVRDLYDAGDGLLLVVASDRISAYDRILPTEIPDKGRILTLLSTWWFERLTDLAPDHLVAAGDDPRIPSPVRGRAMLVRRLDMVPVECVARGYLAGSGLRDYRVDRKVCGVRLPVDLSEGSRLPRPIFTPTTKAGSGEHDENISFETMAATVGQDLAAELRRLTLAIYERAADTTEQRGILLADTKLEFGRHPDTGEIVLADEALTPDSSRFWPARGWSPGGVQPSFDKQFVRDWLTSSQSGWSRHSDEPPPPLPDEVVSGTRAKYVEAYELITGRKFA